MGRHGDGSSKTWGRFFCLRNAQTEEPSPCLVVFIFLFKRIHVFAIDRYVRNPDIQSVLRYAGDT